MGKHFLVGGCLTDFGVHEDQHLRDQLAREPQRGSILEPRKQRQNTHRRRESVRIHYLFHPLYDKEVKIVRTFRKSHPSSIQFETGESLLSPVIETWMTESSSCSRIVSAEATEATIDVASLRELRSLLETQPLQTSEKSCRHLAQERGQGSDDAESEQTVQTAEARSKRRGSLGKALGRREGGLHSDACSANRKDLAGNSKGAR